MGHTWLRSNVRGKPQMSKVFGFVVVIDLVNKEVKASSGINVQDSKCCFIC